MNNECPFCSIVAGKDVSVEVVAETESWLAFFPTEPATPGHTLIIPRRHIADLWQLHDRDVEARLMDAVVRVGRAIERALVPDGMNLITSAGQAAEQTVGHLHLHVVPRWRDDGFGPIWPPKHYTSQRAKDDLVRRIRDAYGEGA